MLSGPFSALYQDTDMKYFSDSVLVYVVYTLLRNKNRWKYLIKAFSNQILIIVNTVIRIYAVLLNYSFFFL